MKSITFAKKTFGARERRKMTRRAEDLKKCMFCDVYFPWEACGPACSECAHKLIVLYTNKGKTVDIVA